MGDRTDEHIESLPSIAIAKPDLGQEEADAARDAVLSGWVTQGPQVAAFEREFAARTGVAHAVAHAVVHRLEINEHGEQRRERPPGRELLVAEPRVAKGRLRAAIEAERAHFKITFTFPFPFPFPLPLHLHVQVAC